MKFGIFVNPTRPKVTIDKIIRHIESAGANYAEREPDIAIVVGGDGTFAYYGTTLSIPVLFVGVKDSAVIGSRAKLAETFYDNIAKSLREMEAGKYSVLEQKLLSLSLNNKHLADILTDVYLERGKFAGCLRYLTSIKLPKSSNFPSFTDYAIGNGVIVSTSLGAGGYYSYPERLSTQKSRGMTIAPHRMGICHIIPTYLARTERGATSESRKIWYTVPNHSIIQIRLLRDAKARLYGTTLNSKGIPIGIKDRITVTSSKRMAKIIKLH